MRVAFYPSFRPVDHVRSSGLVAIARDVHAALLAEGHAVRIPVARSMEWIYRRPQQWPGLAREMWRARHVRTDFAPQCWLTYHSYYRGPDVVGPILARRWGIPYCILAGSYATKYRRQLGTWAGFQLNRWALMRADLIFVNKRRDLENLRRLVPAERVAYIRPGIRVQTYAVRPGLREAMRAQLGLADTTRVVVTAAMMRPGVKEDGVAFVVDACARLRRTLPQVHLLVIGDGPGRERLMLRAAEALPGAHTFVGRVAPQDMHRYYQAGDVFAFPGINESLGMVYLEAQCSGLPVVATRHDGAPEVVADGVTGLIVRPFALDDFAHALAALLTDPVRRADMGRQAQERVLSLHDMQANYRMMFAAMEHVRARSGV